MTTNTCIFGGKYDITIAIDPSAYRNSGGGWGDIYEFLANRKLGIKLHLTTASTTLLEDAIAATPAREVIPVSPCFQLYLTRPQQDHTSSWQRRPVEDDVDDIVVSNHGGRKLDDVAAEIS
ncbi:hypothetical protein BX600DRAFT_515430 [Xylariales sp. PMI_506]|nr:hypothetical protein BX600DRAFT_515430 [Xylariales sp. PMI_506]